MEQSIGRYQTLEEIASGAQGTVHRVFDPEGGQIVALKVLTAPELMRDIYDGVRYVDGIPVTISMISWPREGSVRPGSRLGDATGCMGTKRAGGTRLFVGASCDFQVFRPLSSNSADPAVNGSRRLGMSS